MAYFLLQENGDKILLESGDAILLNDNQPEIFEVNGGDDLLTYGTSIAIEGIKLGDIVYLANNSDFDLADVTVLQVVKYAFSTLVVFDVVPGALEEVACFVFVENSFGFKNKIGFEVTLTAETMPDSTVARDAAETLTSQFAEADLTKDFIEAILSPFDEIDSAYQYLDTQASFEYGAAGTWLDSEGQIIGAKRDALSIPENLFFAFSGPRNGGETPKSTTRGFDGGILRSVFGNDLPGTKEADTDFAVSCRAKALATFRGTSKADIVDFVYELFGVNCLVEFGVNSDVTITPDTTITYLQRDIIAKYAPVSAGSRVVVNRS